jgi:hypothetical protein
MQGLSLYKEAGKPIFSEDFTINLCYKNVADSITRRVRNGFDFAGRGRNPQSNQVDIGNAPDTARQKAEQAGGRSSPEV